jgi:hypothetical protein
MGCRGIVRVLLEPIQQDHILIRTFQTVFDYPMAAVYGDNNFIKPRRCRGRVFYSAIEQFDLKICRTKLKDWIN